MIFGIQLQMPAGGDLTVGRPWRSASGRSATGAVGKGNEDEEENEDEEDWVVTISCFASRPLAALFYRSNPPH